MTGEVLQWYQAAERLALGPEYAEHDLLLCHRDGSPHAVPSMQDQAAQSSPSLIDNGGRAIR